MKIKILILEDNEVDASLLKQYLVRSLNDIHDIEVKWVASGEEYEEVLVAYHPDVIITDYQLRQYSGNDALIFRNKTVKDIPFIIVSGHIGEEKAAQLIKQGATDFLMKNNAEARLAAVVERGLKETREKEKNRMMQLAAERNRLLLEMVTMHADLPVWIRDGEGRFFYVNRQFKKLFNLDETDVIGKTNSELLDEKTAEQFDRNDQMVKEKGEPVIFEEKLTTPQGVRYYQSNLFPIRNLPEIDFAVGGLAADITTQKEHQEELKELNEKLSKHTRELAMSNSELEQFAFLTSHDLQEPLRMITSFMELLQKNYGKQLDEKAHQYIGFALDGAKKMRQVILDLLDFSRVGKIEDKPVPVDLTVLMNYVTQLHRRTIKQKAATIHYSNLPEIISYRGPLIQVIQNLVGNALKFSRTGIAPVVTIECHEKEKEWEFSVKDNGIGIPENRQEEIFYIFNRLHTPDEYAGTGMGLAIAKKIVENLGGEIRVESEEGTGSTFYFTLPKRD